MFFCDSSQQCRKAKVSLWTERLLRSGGRQATDQWPSLSGRQGRLGRGSTIRPDMGWSLLIGFSTFQRFLTIDHWSIVHTSGMQFPLLVAVPLELLGQGARYTIRSSRSGSVALDVPPALDGETSSTTTGTTSTTGTTGPTTTTASTTAGSTTESSCATERFQNCRQTLCCHLVRGVDKFAEKNSIKFWLAKRNRLVYHRKC